MSVKLNTYLNLKDISNITNLKLLISLSLDKELETKTIEVKIIEINESKKLQICMEPSFF